MVTNAKSITSITMTSGSHAAGTSDTYTIAFNDGDTAAFQVYNGANGTGAVSTVAGIGVEGANGNVPLILKGNGAPTTATVGQENQLYFDQTGSNFYICLGESGGTYSWAGTSSITIDAAMSTSSENPVQNKVISTKVGTTSLNTTATDLSNAINEHENDIGNMSLTTSASNLTGAINELDGDITSINSTIGSTALPTTSQTLTGAISEIVTDHSNDVLYLTSVACSATTGNFVSVSNASITANHVVAECIFANPTAITKKATWTTANGSLTLNGTCASATTCDIVLVKKGN